MVLALPATRQRPLQDPPFGFGGEFHDLLFCSAALQGVDRVLDLFLRWDDPEDVRLSVFLAWGTNDRGGIKRLNERFSEHLEESGIHHHAEEYVGDHAWVSWAPVIERALRYQVGREALEPSETTARIVHEG